MRSLTPRSTRLVERQALAVASAVLLKLYSDRQAGTVETTFRFADRDLVWPDDSSYEARLLGLRGPLRSTINHLPDPAEPVSPVYSRPAQIVLSNHPEETGKSLTTLLRAYNLQGATIALDQILLDERDSWWDLSGLSGEQIPWYSGELRVVGPITSEELELDCELVERQIPWYVHQGTSVDPKDVGKRGNIVYGDVGRLPALGIVVGGVSTLAVTLTSTATTAELTDATRFPTSGRMRIGTEEIDWTGKSGNQLTGLTRGANSTTAQQFNAGAIAAEMPASITFEVAHHACEQVPAIYVRNPFNEEIVRVTTAFTTNTNDTTTISGETITSVSFTQAQMSALFNELAQQAGGATVTTQPEFEENDQTNLYIARTSSVVTGTWRNTGEPLTGAAGWVIVGEFGTQTDQHRIRFWFPSNSLPEPTRRVKRWRLRLAPGRITNLETYTCKLKAETLSMPGLEKTAEISVAGSTELVGPIDITGWTSTDPSSTQVEDFEGSGSGSTPRIEVWQEGTSSPNVGTDMLSILGEGAIALEMELEPQALSRTTDTAVAGAAASSGYGLEVFADVRGYVAPDTSYSVAQGVLLQHPADIFRHLLVVQAGDSGIDETSWSAAITNLGSNKHAASLTDLGYTFNEIVTRFGFESRTQLVPGPSWRLRCADSSYRWPGTPTPILDYGRVREDGRDLQTVQTRFRCFYDPDRSASSIELYRAALRADADYNDLTVPSVADFQAAEKRVGRRDHAGFTFTTIRDLATARDVLGYYASELMRDAPIWEVSEIPWVDGYRAEIGDQMSITLPWETVARTANVIDFQKDLDSELVTLRIVEVPTP